MLPMLDDLALPQVQQISSQEQRALPELKPPGMAGSVLQNLGRRPMRIVLLGVATGPAALQFAEKLDAKFRAAKPVPFVENIVADTKIDLVLIDDVKFTEFAGRPQRFTYEITLREFIKPKEPPTTTGALDSSILDDAAKIAAGMLPGLDTGAAFLGGLEPFATKLGAFLPRLAAASRAFSSL